MTLSPTSSRSSGSGGLYDASAYLRDQKASGVNGGNAVATTWTTRTLNTEVFDPDGIVALAANQFTLQAGTFLVVGRAPALFCQKYRVRLRDITAGATAGLGSATYAESGAVTCSADSWVHARVTIAVATTYELQYWVANAPGFGVDLGTPTTTGEDEVYGEVWVWRESA